MSEINNQEQPTQESTSFSVNGSSLTGIDLWNVKFQGLIQEARSMELSAPDVLFILNRTANEIQHQINHMVFNHEHIKNEGE